MSLWFRSLQAFWRPNDEDSEEKSLSDGVVEPADEFCQSVLQSSLLTMTLFDEKNDRASYPRHGNTKLFVLEAEMVVLLGSRFSCVSFY